MKDSSASSIPATYTRHMYRSVCKAGPAMPQRMGSLSLVEVISPSDAGAQIVELLQVGESMLPTTGTYRRYPGAMDPNQRDEVLERLYGVITSEIGEDDPDFVHLMLLVDAMGDQQLMMFQYVSETEVVKELLMELLARSRSSQAAAAERSDDLWVPALSGLLDPPLAAVPSLESLADFLFTYNLSRPVPLLAPVYAQLRQRAECVPYLRSFAVHRSEAMLAEAFSDVLRTKIYGGPVYTEPFTSTHIDNTVLILLHTFERLLGCMKRVGVVMERGSSDSTSGMTSVQEERKALRPDGILRHEDRIRVLLKWEEKGAGRLANAVGDLVSKMPAWPDVYYGRLPYLLTFVAAGSEFQFYAIRREAPAYPVPVGPTLRLDSLVAKCTCFLPRCSCTASYGPWKQRCRAMSHLPARSSWPSKWASHDPCSSQRRWSCTKISYPGVVMRKSIA